MQARLNYTFDGINNFIKKINRNKNLATPHCDQAIKGRRGRAKHGYYIHAYDEGLHDGVHGRPATVKQWANDIAAAIRLNRKSNARTSTTLDTDTDEELGSPKRSWRREKRRKPNI